MDLITKAKLATVGVSYAYEKSIPDKIKDLQDEAYALEEKREEEDGLPPDEDERVEEIYQEIDRLRGLPKKIYPEKVSDEVRKIRHKIQEKKELIAYLESTDDDYYKRYGLEKANKELDELEASLEADPAKHLNKKELAKLEEEQMDTLTRDLERDYVEGGYLHDMMIKKRKETYDRITELRKGLNLETQQPLEELIEKHRPPPPPKSAPKPPLKPKTFRQQRLDALEKAVKIVTDWARTEENSKAILDYYEEQADPEKGNKTDYGLYEIAEEIYEEKHLKRAVNTISEQMKLSKEEKQALEDAVIEKVSSAMPWQDVQSHWKGDTPQWSYSVLKE